MGANPNVAEFLMEMIRILLRPLHNWIWLDTARRARTLLRFAETEADGGRNLVCAAEVTPDPLLRRLFLFHARDEQRHAELFRRRGAALLHALSGPSRSGYPADWLARVSAGSAHGILSRMATIRAHWDQACEGRNLDERNVRNATD